MASGFPPKYTVELYPDVFSSNQFLALAVQAARQLKWGIQYLSEAGFIAITNNGVLKPNSKITLRFQSDTAVLTSESTEGIFDMGRNKKLVEKFTDALSDLRNTISPDEAGRLFEELKPELTPMEKDQLTLPPPTGSEKAANLLSLFRPRPGYFITPILIDLNILVWVFMVFTGASWISPDNNTLLQWGANTRMLTLDGEWWRLLTNCFLHIGVFHLILNMYALLFIGLLLEPRLGKIRFLAAYLTTCITASVCSLWWHDSTISAGASGAIFGMYGVFLALLTTNLIEKKERKPLLTSIGIFVLYNLAYGMKGGVDNAAHIGGLAGGIFFGYGLLPGLKKPESAAASQWATGALATLLLILSFIWFQGLPRDIIEYKKKMELFSINEKKAVHVYQMPPKSSQEDIMAEIKDSGIYYWNQDIALLNEMKHLQLPQKIQERNNKLMDYCHLRVSIYHLVYQSMLEKTDAYDKQIKDSSDVLLGMLDQLKGKESNQ